jgi:hypothetical protein
MSERIHRQPEPEYPDWPEVRVEGGSPMVSKSRDETRTGVARATRRKRRETPGFDQKEEAILRAATLELITKHGGHFVATDLRETRIEGTQVWIITVTLRYTTGHEGYVGDLLYDGNAFTFLTEQSVIDDRVRQIAADPEGNRQWNEYRASTLRPGKE